MMSEAHETITGTLFKDGEESKFTIYINGNIYIGVHEYVGKLVYTAPDPADSLFYSDDDRCFYTIRQYIFGHDTGNLCCYDLGVEASVTSFRNGMLEVKFGKFTKESSDIFLTKEKTYQDVLKYMLNTVLRCGGVSLSAFITLVKQYFPKDALRLSERIAKTGGNELELLQAATAVGRMTLTDGTPVEWGTEGLKIEERCLSYDEVKAVISRDGHVMPLCSDGLVLSASGVGKPVSISVEIFGEASGVTVYATIYDDHFTLTYRQTYSISGIQEEYEVTDIPFTQESKVNIFKTEIPDQGENVAEWILSKYLINLHESTNLHGLMPLIRECRLHRRG